MIDLGEHLVRVLELASQQHLGEGILEEAFDRAPQLGGLRVRARLDLARPD